MTVLGGLNSGVMPVALLEAASAPSSTPDPPSDRPLALVGWTGADSRTEKHQSQLQADLRATAPIPKLTGLPRSSGEITGSATGDPCSVQRMFFKGTKKKFMNRLKKQTPVSLGAKD